MSRNKTCSVCGQEIPSDTNTYKLIMEGPQDQPAYEFTTLLTICSACFWGNVFGVLRGRGVKDAKRAR